MSSQSRLLLILLLFPVTMMLLAVPLELNWLWGLSHLLYLPMWSVALTLAFSFALAAMVVRRFTASPQSQPSTIGSGRDFALHWLIPFGISIVMGAVFWYLQGGFGLLGDGSGILAEFRERSAFYRKMTELGTYELTRWLMSLTTSSSEPTEAAFRIVAAVSGMVAIYFQVRIAQILARCRSEFILFSSTLVFSGVCLQYCGYVEFYAPVWATASAYLYMSLRVFTTGTGKIWVIALWAIACLFHLVAVVFGPATIHLALFNKSSAKKGWLAAHFWLPVVILTAAGMGVGLWVLMSSGLDISRIFIPLTPQSGVHSQYTLFSVKHFADMGNLLLLCYPGTALLLGILYLKRRDIYRDQSSNFLLLCSIGSLAFLVLVDPALGMARDWDLMSFTLLAPMVLLLHLISKVRTFLSREIVAGYVVTILLVSTLFIAVYQSSASAADRQLDLLKRYGDKDRGGWSILIGFEALHNLDERMAKTTEEMDHVFPNYRLLRLASNALREKQIDSALALGQVLVSNDSTQGDFLQILGAAYSLKGDLPQAQMWYERAVAAKPIPPILKELGAIYLMQDKYSQAYEMLDRAHTASPNSAEIAELLAHSAINLHRLDRAGLIIDSLLLVDSTSATAHLLGITVCLQTGDSACARQHYYKFLGYASPGSHTEEVRKLYEFLH